MTRLGKCFRRGILLSVGTLAWGETVMQPHSVRHIVQRQQSQTIAVEVKYDPTALMYARGTGWWKQVRLGTQYVEATVTRSGAEPGDSSTFSVGRIARWTKGARFVVDTGVLLSRRLPKWDVSVFVGRANENGHASNECRINGRWHRGSSGVLESEMRLRQGAASVFVSGTKQLSKGVRVSLSSYGIARNASLARPAIEAVAEAQGRWRLAFRWLPARGQGSAVAIEWHGL
jgi:hypothetical protein